MVALTSYLYPSPSRPLKLPMLMHDIYRNLLTHRRTYAAFEVDEIQPLVKRLEKYGHIFDPMSGYGTLTQFCSLEYSSLATYNLECNPASYYWQLLMNPGNAKNLFSLCKSIEDIVPSLLNAEVAFATGNDWYPLASKPLLEDLFQKVFTITKTLLTEEDKSFDLAVAYCLPFVARLSSLVHCKLVTAVKVGGICVYNNWQEDFKVYNEALKRELSARNLSTKAPHTISFGDARNFTFTEKFSAMLTSPPYPNGADYRKMFAPENAWLEFLSKAYPLENLDTKLIGSPIVSEKEGYSKKRIEDVQSLIAKKFIEKYSALNKSKRAQADCESYYIPYYCRYFYDLETAYANISKHLAEDFEGYIVVVNNTARKIVIPVAESIVEIWKALGFDASIEEEFTRELSHVGGLSPAVKGLNARHNEYTIKVSRNA